MASRFGTNGFSRGAAVALSAVGIIGVLSVFSLSSIASDPAKGERPVEHVPGEILVQFKDDARARVTAAVHAVENRLGNRAVAQIRALRTDPTMQVFRIQRDAEMKEAIAALRAEPSVLIAEPNYLFHVVGSAVPNDPDFAKTWGLKNTGQTDAAGQIGKPNADINVVPVWEAGHKGSRSIVVAVIDTGIDWEHPDLKANLYTNPGEAGDKASNGKDDDGNGFIDDVHGWNFADKSRNSTDDHDHGTHCAGTIGGVGDNGVGVVGVNWEVSLLPIKFLDANGSGALADAVEAINYATQMKVDIMSNSWGGGGYTEALKTAIEKARDAGILFVAAAGNDRGNNDARPSYPASYQIENIVSVAATDNRDALANFSNYGAATVHVAAPGVKVYSTVKGGKYNAFSGTSMATPHVAGIAALLMSADSSFRSFSKIKERLIQTSDPVRGLKTKVVAKGRVNAYNALKGIVPPTIEPDPALWKWEASALESDHPYQNNTDKTYTIKRAGAKYIRVHFEKVETEANYDKVYIQSPSGEVVEDVTGKKENHLSEYVDGDTVVIRLKADQSNTAFGFKIDKIQVIE